MLHRGHESASATRLIDGDMDAAIIEAFERWRRADGAISALVDGPVETAEHCEAQTELEHARAEFLRLTERERTAHRAPTTAVALAEMRRRTASLRRIVDGGTPLGAANPKARIARAPLVGPPTRASGRGGATRRSRASRRSSAGS